MVEFGGHVAQLHNSAGHLSEQFLDIVGGQRAELHAAQALSCETR